MCRLRGGNLWRGVGVARAPSPDARYEHPVLRSLGCRLRFGITPAVNMDTGYVQLIDDTTRSAALRIARDTLGPTGELVAGACVVDGAGAGFDEPAYGQQLDMITSVGGLPVIFPSFGLTAGGDADFVGRCTQLASRVERFIGFELSTEFVPSGRVLSLAAYGELMQIPNCIGAKHSSLSRRLEWDRLALRDRVRPEFHVFTGNDLAIDMVRYGSDWLLGLSTAAPAAFALRDRWWAEGDCRFDELDDATCDESVKPEARAKGIRMR